MDYLTKFNEVFQDMVRDLVNVFPTDAELRLYEFGLKAAFVADKFMVSRIFNENVSGYGTNENIPLQKFVNNFGGKKITKKKFKKTRKHKQKKRKTRKHK